jgi:eukaryotic-like serine/threonine-protein kinase
VMAYVPGETLREKLRRESQLPIDEARRIVREVADALDYAHRSGVIHRDIKPENILLFGGHALVLDFGIARALESSSASDPITLPGVAIGTPAYMSPEQATGAASLDGRADVYALGCVAYEILSGNTPFPGETHQEILRRHSLEPVPRLRKSRADVPEFTQRAIDKSLAKLPADRFPTATAFSEALSNPQRDWRGSARRQPGKWLGAAAAIVMLVFLLKGLGVRQGSGKPGPSDIAPSVAVLAFRNIGGDSTSEALSEGISEEIAGTMGNIPGLSTRSPRSSFALKGRNLTVQQIGSALSVRYLVDGSIQRVGPNLRVHVALLSAANDSTVWTRGYNRSFGDVFAMQDEIASDIAGELKVQLASGASRNLSRRTTSSAHAHELYLRGRFFFQRRDSASLRKAGEYFAAAIRADSTYALAYAGLSDAYSHSSVFGYAAPHANMPRARRFADRALALDNTLAEAHSSLAFIATFYEWDWTRAGREFDKALALDPGYPSGHLWRAWYLLARDSADAGIAEGKRALSLEPFVVLTNTRLISLLYYGHHYEEALKQAQRTSEIDSTFFQLSTERARVLVELGRCADALKAIAHTSRQTPAMLAGTRGYTYAKCGHRADALAELDHLAAEASSGRYVSHYALGVIQAGLGNKDAAFAELERAVVERSWCMFLIKAEPAFDGLRSDRRFAKLAESVGI